MKDFIKRSITFVSIIYILLSLLLNICCSISYKDTIKEFNIPDSKELKEEVVEISNDTSVGDLMQISHYSGRLEVVYYQLQIMTIAMFLGTLISMCMELKENSKIKFILFFIIGNIIFNLFCTGMVILIFKNNGIELDFLEKYIDVTTHTFLIYTIFYFIFLMITFLDMKIKIKRINKHIK